MIVFSAAQGQKGVLQSQQITEFTKAFFLDFTYNFNKIKLYIHNIRKYVGEF